MEKNPHPKISPWLIFTLVAVAQFMVVLDIAITNVALPTIQKQLHFSSSSLQWVITAYALTFGGFLLLGGRTADLFGRRRVLLFGISAFTFFSLLVGLSNSAPLLIILRALQGLSAAFMSPSALSIVVVTFREGPMRNRALAYWTLIATGGAAVGLLLGGALTQYINWRWNFFINIPVGLLILFAILRVVPQDEKVTETKHVDLGGAFLITISLMLQVLVFSEGSMWGWFSIRTVGIFILALVLLVGFLYNESKIKHPLMPLSIFKIRNVVGGNAMMAPMYGAMLGMFFLTTLYIQGVLHFSPALTGLSFLPFPVILGFMSTRIPRWVGKWGFKRFLIVGPILSSTALFLLAHATPYGQYYITVLPTLLLMPIGVGMTIMPIFAAATSGIPSNEAGLASGLINTSQQMGGALGLAILSGVAATVTAHATGANHLFALVSGFDHAYLVAAGFMLLVAFLGAIVIKQPHRASRNEDAQQIAIGA